MKRVLVLYIPVLHAGYLKFFKKHGNKVSAFFILGEDFIKEFAGLHREIRALSPSVIKQMVETLDFFPSVSVLNRGALKELKQAKITTADEEISRKFADKYLRNYKVKFEPVFLRWDEKLVKTARPANCTKESNSKFDRKMTSLAVGSAKESSDWWRRVGAVIVKNKKAILVAHNRHVPSEHVPYIDGDPRDFIRAGESPELSTVLHAEQALVAEAAQRGISLKGTSIYVTTFPCPLCAKLIAYSGIGKCFFRSGSATLDGERILKAKNVRVIRVI